MTKTSRCFKVFSNLLLLIWVAASAAFALPVDETVAKKVKLIHEAQALEKNGHFDEALEKYKGALAPQLNEYEWQEASARGGIVQNFIMQGRYDQALNENEWFVERNKKNNKAAIRTKEIRALKEYKQNGNKDAVYSHIDFLRAEEANHLPPNSWNTYSVSPVSTIIRLYDTLGDQVAGIKFIGEILAYFRTGKAGDPKPGKVDAEYMKIREAFEQDKAEGFKGCAHSKPGEVCMGRATKALIQSDYFPW